METKCPNCGSLFTPEDVNVEKDAALCRSCGHGAVFSQLLDSERVEHPDIDLSNPPRGAWYRDDGQEVVIGATTRSPAAFFLVPFAVLWSGGSIGMIYGSQIIRWKFDIVQSLLGIPFLLGSIMLWSMALMFVCGKVEVKIRGAEGRVFVGVGKIVYRKRFDASGIRRVYERK